MSAKQNIWVVIAAAAVVGVATEPLTLAGVDPSIRTVIVSEDSAPLPSIEIKINQAHDDAKEIADHEAMIRHVLEDEVAPASSSVEESAFVAYVWKQGIGYVREA